MVTSVLYVSNIRILPGEQSTHSCPEYRMASLSDSEFLLDMYTQSGLLHVQFMPFLKSFYVYI